MYKNDLGLGYSPEHTAASLLAFKLEDENNNQIYNIDLTKKSTASITINAVVALDKDFLSQNQDSNKQKIYLLTTAPSAEGAYISVQKILLPIDNLKKKKSNLVNLIFKVDIPKEITPLNSDISYKINDVDLCLTMSYKEMNDMGHSESFRVGTFLTTRISVEQ